MNETGRITLQEVLELPRWARLVFAVQCLRRAQPLVRAQEEPLRLLSRALGQIEEAARTGCVGDDLAETAAAAYTLALDHLDSTTGARENENDTIVTCMVAHAAAFAAEAATLSEPRRAAQLVAQSADFAVHAFRVARSETADDAVAGMRADLARLHESVSRAGVDEHAPATT